MMKPREALFLATTALLLAGCATTKVVGVRAIPDDETHEIVITKSCRATGPMQEGGVYSFQLTRMASNNNMWGAMILGLPLDIVFLPLQALRDLCCHTCTTTEEKRPRIVGTAL